MALSAGIWLDGRKNGPEKERILWVPSEDRTDEERFCRAAFGRK